MKKVVILGATRSVGRIVSQELEKIPDVYLTLFSRSLKEETIQNKREVIAGDIYDDKKLTAALKGADLVFVALSGDLPTMATKIISAMKSAAVNRIIFVTSYGIYGERVGQNGKFDSILRPYREAADLVEESGLAYTILRPGWFDNEDTSVYHLIPKGETVYGNVISRRAIAQFVADCVEDLSQHLKENLAIIRE